MDLMGIIIIMILLFAILTLVLFFLILRENDNLSLRIKKLERELEEYKNYNDSKVDSLVLKFNNDLEFKEVYRNILKQEGKIK